MLRYLEQGKQLLEELKAGVRTGDITPCRFPLLNILLSPMVVLGHLIEYTAFVRGVNPNLADNEPLPSSVTAETEILGLCTGVLSAFAVGSSSTLAELAHYGAIAVRLSMLVGALVDVEQLIPGSHGPSTSFSIFGNVDKVLENLPEVTTAPIKAKPASTLNKDPRPMYRSSWMRGARL